VQIVPGQPAYAQIAAELRRQIASGELKIGDPLPSMSQLRAMYQVSNTVVREALNELRREGLTQGQQGRGVFVRAKPEQDDRESSDTRSLLDRLDTLTRTARKLDERLVQLDQRIAQLERTVGRSDGTPPPTAPAAD
jgi:DNA-binding GntR family transcriptional regulator